MTIKFRFITFDSKEKELLMRRSSRPAQQPKSLKPSERMREKKKQITFSALKGKNVAS